MEVYEEWVPLPDCPRERFLTAVVVIDHPDATVRLQRGTRNGQSLGPDLIIKFSSVPAVSVHEEFAHPLQEDPESPPWPADGYPYAIVRNSCWLASFSDSQLLHFPDCKHYRLLTLFPFIDILCNVEPHVYWDETS